MGLAYEKSSMVIRSARPADMGAIRAIRNHAIEHSTALWTTALQSAADATAWLDPHLARGSAFVAEINGETAGFASYGPWRALEGYRHTVGNSIYVRDSFHRLGVGSALMAALIGSARETGHHLMIADIESENTASIRLHERFDFRTVGKIHEAGFKFGRWLDLTIMQLPLTQPAGSYRTADALSGDPL